MNNGNNMKEYIEFILNSLSSQVLYHRILPETKGEHKSSRIPWPRAISNLLQERQISLYSHQALATDHIRAGHSVVISTPTASGKSLIYNLPVLEKYLMDPEASSLYLFPLKALAHDQMLAFNSLCKFWPESARPSIAMYDGDTEEDKRRKIRSNPPQVLITNPEMLHLSILPFHEKWSTFLANLSFIVVDEAHVYRGVFGCHMAQVFRRLNRILARYGNAPLYIFSTATLGNPEYLAKTLMNAGEHDALAAIKTSGAPQSQKHFIFVDPLNAPSTCAINLLKNALEKDLRVLVYCASRKMTELIAIWAGESGIWKDKISSYRAGYLPYERREIEKKMASGELRAVISTSALELGIDIGGIDVCILAGYPGTITQTMQRGGRAGRAGQESAVILIAGEDALDQYIVRHPEDFFDREPEKAAINPFNEVILSRHLECAANEMPISVCEPLLKIQEIRKCAENLEKAGILQKDSAGIQWLAMNKNPHRGIDLRGCGQSYHIEDQDGKIIGSIDGFRAFKETHPGAVYLHHGQSYVIECIDNGEKRILAKKAKVGWFTRARGYKTTDILEEYGRKFFGSCTIFFGKLRITEYITGYEQRAADNQRLLGIQPLDTQPHIFETEGIWIIIGNSIRHKLEDEFIHFTGSIHALEHAAIGIMPLMVMADRNDFGGISAPMHAQLGFPAVFIYDAIPGGAGLAKTAFAAPEELIECTIRTIEDCACTDGCPSCIHSPKCGSGNRPLSKHGAVMLLKSLLEEGNEAAEIFRELKISRPIEQVIINAEPPKPVKKPEKPALDINAEAFFARLETSDKQSKIAGNYLVFDVETRHSAAEAGGWRNAAKMGISIVCCYDSRDNKIYAYQQDELGEFFKKLSETELVIGFNSIRFDYEVLKPFAETMAPAAIKPFLFKNLPSLDLLQKVTESLHYRVSLDNLAQATLGAKKSANGLLALKWWKEGKLDKITEYCKKDVELTHELYKYGFREKCLFFTNKSGCKVKFKVDFGS